MTPVKSSNIASVDHDGQHLTVQFKSGQSWRYQDVPAAKHDAMIAAPSAGKYFASEIKPHHVGTKLD